MKNLFLLIGLFFSVNSFCQESSIYGKITDQKNGEELIFVNISFMKDSIYANSASTDLNGNYSIILDPGIYDVEIAYTWYKNLTIKNVEVKHNQVLRMDTTLIYDESLETYEPPSHYREPLIMIDKHTEQDLISANSKKQSYLYGKVIDKELGEELIYANIIITKNGQFKAGGTTDFEGNYSIPVAPGIYEVRVQYTGYNDRVISPVIIKEKEDSKLDIQLVIEEFDTIPFIVKCITIPLIHQDETSTGQMIYGEEIRNLGVKDINAILLSTPGVSISNF